MGTFQLGRLFGIPIRATPAFLYVTGILLLIALFERYGGLVAVLTLVFLLVALLLHELGHALLARSLGIPVIDITLSHMGGMARMGEIRESPRIEASVAAAGPAVNLALALFAAPLLLLDAALGALGAQLVTIFVLLNIAFGVLNLLPAFPMDGGRLLRAFLATRMSYLDATEHAVRVSTWMSVAFLVAGAWFGLLGFFLSLLVVGFLWWHGMRELILVRLRHSGSPFARAAPRHEDVVAEGGAVFESPRRAASDEAPEHGARRPTGPPIPPREGGRGFSDEDVERFESWRGPLRRDPN